MKRIFYIVFLCIVLVSCQTESTRIKSVRIDSLLVIVDSLNQQILKIDIDSVNAIFSGSGELIEKFSALEKLNNEKEEVPKIASLVAVNRNCGRFVDMYSDFQNELTISEHQLITLQQDLEQKNLSDSLFQKYFEEEDTILSKLSKDIDHSINTLQYNISLYQKVCDELRGIMDSIVPAHNTVVN
ncbi:MAG: hypothetical protein K9H64_20540 [Bacteroidales bacterium]|nr:hypothetical protein [Bacteroidales bacterium]MCF8458442.1 hypothetical protein [Bacteroidales bacterium]